MNLISSLQQYWQRRQRKKIVTRAVLNYSRQQYPRAIPAWSLIAENRPQECVVYQTYEAKALPASVPAHRYFLVKLDDLTVRALGDDYRPVIWGPHL